MIGIPLILLASVSQWEGNYTATSSWDGGDVEIHRMRGGSLRINLSVWAKDGCSGELEFVGNPKTAGNADLTQLYLTSRDRADQFAQPAADQCSLTLFHERNGIIVAEHDCSDEHGAACVFEGRYHRTAK